MCTICALPSSCACRSKFCSSPFFRLHMLFPHQGKAEKWNENGCLWVDRRWEVMAAIFSTGSHESYTWLQTEGRAGQTAFRPSPHHQTVPQFRTQQQEIPSPFHWFSEAVFKLCPLPDSSSGLVYGYPIPLSNHVSNFSLLSKPSGYPGTFAMKASPIIPFCLHMSVTQTSSSYKLTSSCQ